MRRSKDSLLRTIAGETILIPTGAAARQLSGLVTLNELGAFIWQQLADDCTLDTIAARITAEYDVDDATARADAENFLQSLHEIGALAHF